VKNCKTCEEWKDRLARLMTRHERALRLLSKRRELCTLARRQRDGLCWSHNLPIEFARASFETKTKGAEAPKGGAK